eukprot:scaffold39695_cov206-Amphora_coffeaeformis.AAC.3
MVRAKNVSRQSADGAIHGSNWRVKSHPSIRTAVRENQSIGPAGRKTRCRRTQLAIPRPRLWARPTVET